MTIVERDIEFYQGEAERCRDNRRRCEPGHERLWFEQEKLADAVVEALRAYAGQR